MRRSMNCGDSTKPTNANACRRWSTMRSCNARSRYRRDGFVLRSRQLGSLRRLPLGLNERTDKPCVRKAAIRRCGRLVPPSCSISLQGPVQSLSAVRRLYGDVES
jgi:hypothetical protein